MKLGWYATGSLKLGITSWMVRGIGLDRELIFANTSCASDGTLTLLTVLRWVESGVRDGFGSNSEILGWYEGVPCVDLNREVLTLLFFRFPASEKRVLWRFFGTIIGSIALSSIANPKSDCEKIPWES
jgi:hypothetical protein